MRRLVRLAPRPFALLFGRPALASFSRRLGQPSGKGSFRRVPADHLAANLEEDPPRTRPQR